MNLKDELRTVKTKTAKKAVVKKGKPIVKIFSDEVPNESKKSLLPEVEISNTETTVEQSEQSKPEPKNPQPKEQQIVIQNQPPTTKELVLDFEITPEMAGATLQGILESIHIIAPKTFNSPLEKHIIALKQPTYTVMTRWVKKIDILKYLPEIALAAGIIATLKDMRVTEVKK